MLHWTGRIILLVALITASACSLSDEELTPNPVRIDIMRAETRRDDVFILRGGQREALPLTQQILLNIGEGFEVDQRGRAAFEIEDLLNGELLAEGEVRLHNFVESGPSLEVTLRQNDGVLTTQFNSGRQPDRVLILQTGTFTVTTNSASLVVAREPDQSTWVVNLGSGAADTLQLTVAGETLTIPANVAHWVAPGQGPGPALPVQRPQLEEWLSNLRNSSTAPALGQVLLPPADMLGAPTSLTVLPEPGQPFEIASSPQGTVHLTLDPIGLFGVPTYTLEDCNGDGSRDIAILSGMLQLDFSNLVAQVRALDVAIVNRDQTGNGALWTLDATGNEIARQLFEVGGGQSQTLSLRSEKLYHAARLAMVNGCFAGFSLTPPTSIGTPAPPRPPVVQVVSPESVVVNVLSTPESTESSNTGEDSPVNLRRQDDNPMEATAVAAGALAIDGQVDDWDTLGLSWTRFNTVIFDEACPNRYPGAEGRTDLSGQVRFAYDEQNLYVAFLVEDDGYVGYSGDGLQYFLGDSPQLSLDMDLLGDYNDTGRSQDDWQVDFYPDVEAPQAVLWQLAGLNARNFEEAELAAALTETGYLVEAALPWRSLGASPRPGDRLGLAANVNDNDTPAINVQECIISTAPARVWSNPTTWGTLFLRPPTGE